ncbi:hypothetical protein [Frigidibacter sp. MR17.24]|uniref:hypothetical protein n=1 Tax=Frigidibacter sp. MR17.24 TaxID=3127345 RepID=UPI003012E233
MTEHSIKELIRQFEVADAKATQARRDANVARQRAADAMVSETVRQVEAKGIEIGKTLVRVRNGGSVSSEAYFVVGAEEEWQHSHRPRVRVKLAKIKKDGTPSSAPSGWRGSLTPDMLEIVEPRP